MEAQEGYCPLCGRKDQWEAMDTLKDDNQGVPGPTLPYFRPTWEHVEPESDGARFLGNVLVAHNGCNSRKARSLPMAHEVAVLRVVNERLGWDGVTYSKTAVGRNFYAALMRVLAFKGDPVWYVSTLEPLVMFNLICDLHGIDHYRPELHIETRTYEEIVERSRRRKALGIPKWVRPTGGTGPRRVMITQNAS